MSRRKRSPEEQARREKIRELLQTSGISSMEDIQNLFKETIAEFMVYIPPREHHLHGVLAPRSRCFSATLYGVEHHPL
ncbi:hypothetical protein [Ruminococcus sp. JE7B6]|uniref:hypothetical protein n=1 Tax=Ruminococcus sp. JE7B6 TaxID=3233380 RepID=UPI003899A24E